MPKPLPARKRSAILADIKAGKKRNQIARDHGVSAGTVTNIAKAENVTGAFDRSQTKIATEAAVADNRAWRAATSRKFLAKCNDLLDQMDRPHIVFNIGGKDNVYTEHLMGRPPTADLRNLMTSAAVALDKHLAVDKHDASEQEGLNSVDAWLSAMVEGQGH